jgi:alpha-N-arabinofuranosidase
LGVVNPTLQPTTVPLTIRGARLKGTGTRWQIAGTDPMAFNDPEAGLPVVIQEQPVSALGDQVVLPACSVTVLAWDAE